ncbi:MAG: HAMP domain-containing protein [Gemmataceae bacterium]|nr:HAMP domain-containing protein [Gemmataceae bacterium]
MKISLRWRILATLVPLLLLLAIQGAGGAILLYRLSGHIDAILRENYRSVVYMERLNEALERIDSSFKFALADREDQGRKQYEANWVAFDENLRLEQENITLPGEADLVDQLAQLSQAYRKQGKAFYARPSGDSERKHDYFGGKDRPGLLDRFNEIKEVSAQILRINQQNMGDASQEAKDTAAASLSWFALGMAATVLLAGLLTWHTVYTILHPIRAVTSSALGISAGNLDQLVPAVSNDELGQLAIAFNLMARHLRDFRQSQSHQLLRAQRTSQATIDSFPDAVLVIDAEGEVEMANPAARRLLGAIPKQQGQAAAGLWQPPEPLRQPLADALQGSTDYLPEGFDRVILLGPNGQECAVLPRIMTIRDPYGHTLGAAVVLHDVTRLRLLDQVKSNLVATASHELKTPLTSVRLAVHLLLEETVGPLSPKQTELLIDARENCERLLAMVNNLLDLARLEQGWQQLAIQPEAPTTLLQAAADAIRPRADDMGIDIAVEVPSGLPALSVDTERIKHALGNLLDNALTYTERGGRVTLSAAADGEAVVLTVADTGCGIPPEYLPHVFDKFFRVPGQSRGGTGLGLAIVHEVVVAHTGSVSCESRPGEGTAFRLRLPAAPVDPAVNDGPTQADGTGVPQH